MNQRIIGIDISRALAVFGMIVVNFKIVIGAHGASWLEVFTETLSGKASATFVVLAGIGLALSTRKARKSADHRHWLKARFKIMKRAFFLFVIGLIYIPIWPADILHFYGIYMLLTLLFMRSKPTIILISSLFIALLYPFLLTQLDYNTGWDFETISYSGFWTLKGFCRNLFINGFHPVIPWTSFMLFGFWLGLNDLRYSPTLKRIFWVSLTVFGAVQLLSRLPLSVLFPEISLDSDLNLFFSTQPMPPLPLYMLNGASFASLVISACIILSRSFIQIKIAQILMKTGQLALTFYVAHVVLGMGLLYLVAPFQVGSFSLEFSILYSLAFILGCVWFAHFWLQSHQTGPIEALMNKLLT